MLAAGGVVTRAGTVALIHRPKYDDWTLPKGKLDLDETFEQAALREVEEETGFRCRLGRELPSSEYEDAKGRAKLVRYWMMEPVSGEFAPNREVDELHWLGREEALELLTHDHDRRIVQSAVGGPG